jgi:hypothetical protein
MDAAGMTTLAISHAPGLIARQNRSAGDKVSCSVEDVEYGVGGVMP